MAVLKCKMCGGDLNIEEGLTVAECEYCGSKQTVPTADNEKKMTLFARANRLRAACEFDKAAGVYESIVAEFPEEAEAYWGLLLCKFGIEYVDDPAMGKKIPTCHRSSFDSIMDDNDFEQVMENADTIARRVYREEAKQIEELRKSIIEVSSKEEPYDIFICYKETDENGNRTIDSVIAQDVYDALTEKEYKVFFSRITLEDKLGQEYEPYIFAALNSAKVMLAFGTDYEYYNAVWVKNEWSRFLALIAKGEKKTLIPCYKDIDAYDMPKEFKHLQAQDMGKVGAVQDLLRGIGKILGVKSQPTGVINRTLNTDTEALRQRGYMALEDGDFREAEQFFERVLDVNPSDARAYLGKFFVQYHIASLSDLGNKVIFQPEENKLFKRAEQFADLDLAAELSSFLDSNAIRIERIRLIDVLKKTLEKEKCNEALYTKACSLQESGMEKDLAKAEVLFGKLNDFKDSAERFSICKHAYEKIKVSRESEAKNRLAPAFERINQYRGFIAAGDHHTVGLKSDGTVITVGDNHDGQCDVKSWNDIVAITAGKKHTVGVKSDGTVVAVGNNGYNEVRDCDWTDITAVAAGEHHIVGLRSDGTVVAVGYNKFNQCDVSNWSGIVAIAAGNNHTVGLKSDGTVVAEGHNRTAQCDVSEWRDIIAIAAGINHTVGLKSDGTVVAVGNSSWGQCAVSGWFDIVSIAAGKIHTVGLRADGTVVAIGDKENNKCEVNIWRDIVAIAAGGDHTVGLKSNGSVVAVGDNFVWGQCDVSEWKLFRSEEEKEADYIVACDLQKSGEEQNLEKAANAFAKLSGYKDSDERAATCIYVYEQKKTEREERNRAAAERRRAEEAACKERERAEKTSKLNEEKVTLQTELSNLKGLFTGKRRREIEARLAGIDHELNQL